MPLYIYTTQHCFLNAVTLQKAK